MHQTSGHLSFIGPIASRLQCLRGQLCVLSLQSSETSTSRRWPDSRVLAVKGSCDTNFTLAYTFPTNISGDRIQATPGVSELYSASRTRAYSYTDPISEVEPDEFMLCWCVVQNLSTRRKACVTTLDYQPSGEAGYLVVHGPLNPLERRPCWRGGSCPVAGYG